MGLGRQFRFHGFFGFIGLGFHGIFLSLLGSGFMGFFEFIGLGFHVFFWVYWVSVSGSATAMLQGSLPKGLQERNTIRVALKGPLVMFTARGFTSSPQGSFIWVPYVNPTILGLLAQGFLIRFLH